MADYKALIQELSEAALHPARTVTSAMEQTKKKAIGCFPIYTPEEIIYAAGYLPVGMWGGNTELKLADRYLQSFCCSIMRSNMEYGMKGTYHMLSAVVLPTFCDTLKCICENWKVAVPGIPIVPMVYPQNRRTKAGFEYLIAELKRVKDEIQGLDGKSVQVGPVTDGAVEEAYELYEEYRRTMRAFVAVASDYPQTLGARTRHLIIKAGWFMDKKDYVEKVKAILDGIAAEAPETFDGIRVVATGLLAEPTELLSLFEENGIVIAADDLAQESRQFRTPGRGEGTVWEKLAYRVVDQRGCTFLYEAEKSRGRMLIDMVREKKAQAVVVFMMKFCDPEELDYPVYKEELDQAGIPILYLEIDQQMDSFEQIRTRVQSFAEMF